MATSQVEMKVICKYYQLPRSNFCGLAGLVHDALLKTKRAFALLKVKDLLVLLLSLCTWLVKITRYIL